MIVLLTGGMCRAFNGLVMLINCVAYQEGKKLSDIPVDAISDYLEKPDTFVWVALRDPTRRAGRCKEEFGLHELAVEDALRGNQRPKIEEYGDSLFAVIQTVELRRRRTGTWASSMCLSARIMCCPRAATPRRASSACARAPSASRICWRKVRPSCCTR